MSNCLRIRKYFLDVNRYYIGYILKEPQIFKQPAHFKHRRNESDNLALHNQLIQQVFNQTNIPPWICGQSTGLIGVEAESTKKLNTYPPRMILALSIQLSSEGLYVRVMLMP